jgi:hypothetical protein
MESATLTCTVRPLDAAVAAVAARVRRLPPVVVRVLCIIDIFCGVVPFWAYFLYRRWTGIRLSISEFAPIYARGCRFVARHLFNTGEGTGPFTLDWIREPPVRRSPLTERPGHAPKGSCGTCRNCCTTFWEPPGRRAPCPYLALESGQCNAHAGLWWDYFNCGRYPASPAVLPIYDCGRFAAAPRALDIVDLQPLPLLPEGETAWRRSVLSTGAGSGSSSPSSWSRDSRPSRSGSSSAGARRAGSTSR